MPADAGSAPEEQGADYDEAEFADEGMRMRLDKRGVDEVGYDPAEEDRPEFDGFDFEVEDVGEGEEFMAVKPWIGAVVEPDNHPEVNKEVPDTTYHLEYAYGYRCQDSRQNVYYNCDGNVTYMTAALGVILDKASNTQKFFGGGECENASK